MSKHPTSELSPRDMACIEYGKLIGVFETEFVWLPNPVLWDRNFRAMKRAFLQDLREVRERIFRNCGNCAKLKGDSVVGHGCEWKESICDGTEACTCPHYEERES